MILKHSNEEYLCLETNYHYIQASQRFFEYFEKEYASDYFKKYYCWYDIDNNVQCQCDMVLGKGIFDLVLDISDEKTMLVIRSDEIFQRGSRYCQMIINVNKNDNCDWVLGVEMVKRVNIEFDYDKKEILFIGDLDGKSTIVKVDRKRIMGEIKKVVEKVRKLFISIGGLLFIVLGFTYVRMRK
jgi:hypothetical protein